MAINDDGNQVRTMMSGALGIRSQAQVILGLSGTVPYDKVRDPLIQMRLAYLQSVEPFFLLGAAAANGKMAGIGISGYPADTHAALTTLRDALITFYTAFKTLHDGAGNTETFTIAAGFGYVPVTAAARASLTTGLNSIVTACGPVERGQ